MPRKEKSIETSSKERILIVADNQEQEILFELDTEKSEKKEEKSLLGFVTEKTTTPTKQQIPIIATTNGDANVTITLEHQRESWFSAFSHKIPYLVFFPFLFLMTLLCIVRRLSLIPVLGVMCCTYLMTELGIVNWTRFGAWLLLGLIVYFCYGYWNSKLHRREEAAES